jgi:hypothetical protein
VPNLRDWYLQTAKAGANAVRTNGIPRVVNISSISAGAKPNLGTVSFDENVESIFNQTTANVVHLRPGYFMENFLAQVEAIQRVGVAYSRNETLRERNDNRVVRFSYARSRDPIAKIQVMKGSSCSPEHK